MYYKINMVLSNLAILSFHYINRELLIIKGKENQ
jgi:hypothetical protein